MASIITEFKLDFTMHMQKCDLPTQQKASAAYSQTVANAPLGIGFRQQRQGIFIIETYNEADSNKLEDKSLTYYYGKNENKQAKVVLTKLPKFVFYSNAKWVTIDWLNDGNLRYVKNSQLDEFLAQFGKIIVPVKNEKNELGMYNGKKKFRIDLNKDTNIERIKWLEFTVELEDGTMQNAKGKAKFYYQGQPAFCRRCSKDHIRRCPQLVKEEEVLKDYEIQRKEKCSTIAITDSNFSLANEKSMFLDTNVASGAKIGHGVNVLENTDLEGYKNVIINLGLNNLDLSAQTDFGKWHNQVENEIDRLKTNVVKYASEGKNVRLIAVPDAPITKYTNQAKKMKKTVNIELERLADFANKKYKDSVKVLSIPTKNDEESFRDNIHYTEKQTAIMLEFIDESLPQDSKMIIRNRPKGVLLTTPRVYSGVYGTYKFGCGKCTQIGHNNNMCPLSLVREEGAESNKSKRSERLSSTEEVVKHNKVEVGKQ